MILMTLIVRVWLVYPKKIAVKRLIDEQYLDVIFLQETMFDGSVLVMELESMLKGW